MTDLLKRIYNDILVWEENTVKIDRKVSEKINEITDRYSGQLTPDKLEMLKDILYEVAFTAEHAGLKIGMKFILELLYSVFED